MTEDDRVQYLFEAALELDAAGRDAFLRRECSGNAALLAELRGLLAGDVAAELNPSWERPAIESEIGRLGPLPDEHLGETIGPYRLMEAIGSGGMGKVYRAVRADDEFHQSVAIKLIRSGEDAGEIVQRFRLERQILANLQHPNIARLLDGGTTSRGLPYLVMEYIDGEPLDAWCAKHQPSLGERLRMFRQVCAAVQYAHQRMVIHRDLKPGNILVAADGTPKLVDFGISRLLQTNPFDGIAATATMTGARMLTPRYSSPEQVRGEPVTSASDIYSLGVVLYELLAGRSPYTSAAGPTHEVMRAVCEEEPSKPSIAAPALRGDLDNIVLMALRKDPARRYASVDQFAEDIRRFEEGYPVLARPDTRRYRAARFLRRNRPLVAAAMLVFLTLVGGIAGTAWQAHIANQRFQDVRQLAHSMLFDYHDALADLPGALNLRTRMVKDSLEYMDRLSKQAGRDRDLQLELAGGYLKVGDVQARALHANLGDTKGGFESYRKAIALLEGLRRRAPANEEAEEELAVAYQHLGELNQQSGDVRAAVDNLQTGIAILEKLCAHGQYPSKLRLWSDVVDDRRAWLAPMYGWMARATGEPVGASLGNQVEAERWYRKELALYESMGHEPKLLVSVGSVHSNLGGLLTNAGKNPEALVEYQAALAIDLKVAKTRSDPLARRELAIAYHNVGVGFLGTHDFDGALKSFQAAGTHLEALAAADVDDVNIRVTLADNTRRIGESLFRRKEIGPAIATYRQAIDMYEHVSAKTPANTAVRFRAGVAYLGLSLVEAALRDGPATIDAAGRSARIFEAMGPDNRSARQSLARAYDQTGQGQAIGGHWREAREWYQRSVDLYQDLQGKGLAGVSPARLKEAADGLAEADRHLGASK